jgi:transitional endoplasmic reticulum ATPase
MDEAALRTGRFGELIYVGLPDFEARHEMLRRGLEGVPMADDIDLDELTRRLDGYTGADLNGFLARATDLPYEREIASGQPSQMTWADVEDALARSKPSVTERQLARYDKFQNLR